MEIDFSFYQLCEARQEQKGKKYEYFQCSKCGEHFSVMFAQKDIEGKEHSILRPDYITCDGILERHNQAEKRNCALDVAEELADIVNICQLWLDKEGSRFFWAANVRALMKESKRWGDFMLRIAKNGKDEIPLEVERVVPKKRHEVGRH